MNNHAVNYGDNTLPSGELLAYELNKRGYNGLSINWGYQVSENALNPASKLRIAQNKRLALIELEFAGVPIPKLYVDDFEDIKYPVVGRRDKHTRGSGFFMCYDQYDFDKTRMFNRPPTYYLEFIGNAREFRVYSFQGKSIRLVEKVGFGLIKKYSRSDDEVYFTYPEHFNKKQELRSVAHQAVEALGLDFGAVDILYKNGQFYVIEVNTAPQLTEGTKTLQAFVDAFMNVSKANAKNSESQNVFLQMWRSFY